MLLLDVCVQVHAPPPLGLAVAAERGPFYTEPGRQSETPHDGAIKERAVYHVVDGACGLPHDGFTMAPVTYDRERRSSRAFLRIKLVASGKNQRGRRFRQACETIVVSAHGGLLCIPQELEMGAEVTVTSPFTLEEQECRVMFLGDESEKGWRVGIEFLTPAPRFWGIEFLDPASSRLAPVSQQN